MKRRALLGVATVWMMLLADSTGRHALAYPDGAPAGFTGGFGEPSCHGCHFHEDLNSGSGKLAISGLPDRFAAGERYPITVTLTRAGMKLAGFQLTARFKDGGAQAGSLAPASAEEARVRIDLQETLQYAGHRRAGAMLARPDLATWSLVWTAPATVTPVVLHAAANAANGDETAEGDFVYTATAQSF